MLERGRGRIVITGSGAAYLPGSANSAYSASKAAVWRLGEVLARQLEGRIPVFVISPGPRPHADDDLGGRRRAVDAADSRASSSCGCSRQGRADALSGRYIHAEHDDIEDLIARADEVRENDLNAIRLQR
jgi:NAD(P)-dependent dehydrogenase (short-subunit alcohol dehydrogenase family)